jgi:hypothetical protein
MEADVTETERPGEGEDATEFGYARGEIPGHPTPEGEDEDRAPEHDPDSDDTTPPDE